MRARAPPSLRVNLTLASSPARVTLSYRFATLFASQIIFPRGKRLRPNQTPTGNLIADQIPTGKPFSHGKADCPHESNSRGEHGHANGNQFPTGKTIAAGSNSRGELDCESNSRGELDYLRESNSHGEHACSKIKLPRGKRLRANQFPTGKPFSHGETERESNSRGENDCARESNSHGENGWGFLYHLARGLRRGLGTNVGIELVDTQAQRNRAHHRHGNRHARNRVDGGMPCSVPTTGA